MREYQEAYARCIPADQERYARIQRGQEPDPTYDPHAEFLHSEALRKGQS